MTRGRVIAGITAGVAVIVFGVLASIAIHYHVWTQRLVLSEGTQIQMVIPHGASWPRISSILIDAGLISEPRYFEFWATSRGLDASIKAGHFTLVGPLTLEGLEERLRAGGHFDEIAITVVEGRNIFQLADELDAAGIVGREDFLKAARDREAMAQAEVLGESFEGYLFPDTYRIRKGSTAAEIIQKLKERFDQVYAEELAAHAESVAELEETYAFDQHAFVTMASLVEKETGRTDERSTIAQVFYNRLDKNMKLQTDPTCVYSQQTYKRRPRPSLCKDKLNRYSTYVIEGLPPGPITNPGRESIRAALSPDRSPAAKRYLFFVAKRDGKGSHKFSETYKAHKKAVRQFLRSKR